MKKIVAYMMLIGILPTTLVYGDAINQLAQGLEIIRSTDKISTHSTAYIHAMKKLQQDNPYKERKNLPDVMYYLTILPIDTGSMDFLAHHVPAIKKNIIQLLGAGENPIISKTIGNSAWEYALRLAKKDSASSKRKTAREIINLFIDTSKNLNAQTIDDKKTALHLAITYNDLETIKSLIKHGAQANIPDAQNQTALHLALEQKNKEILSLLLDSLKSIDKKNRLGINPLLLVMELEPKLLAMKLETETIINNLLNNYADSLSTIKNPSQQTLLHIAAKNRHRQPSTIDALLKKIPVNAQDNNDNTALHLAVEGPNPHRQTIIALLENGANLDAKNKDAKTPLDLATHDSAQDAQDVLFDYYKDPLEALEAILTWSPRKVLHANTILKQLKRLRPSSQELDFIHNPNAQGNTGAIYELYRKHIDTSRSRNQLTQAFADYYAIKQALENEQPNYLTILQNIATQYTSATSFIPDLLSELGTTSEDLQFIAGKTVTTDLGKKLQTIYTSAKTQNNKEFVAQMIKYYTNSHELEKELPVEIAGAIASYQ